MILVDSEVLVALVNRGHPRHRTCVETLRDLREPLATVWPVLADALTSTAAIPAAQVAILEMVARGALRLLALGQEDAPRLGELLTKRRRRQAAPSLAHAALAHVARRDGAYTAFTLAPSQLAAVRRGGRKLLRTLPRAGRQRA